MTGSFLEGLVAKQAAKEQAQRPAINNIDSLAAMLAAKPATMDLIGAANAYEQVIPQAPQAVTEGLNEMDIRRNLAATQGLAAYRK